MIRRERTQELSAQATGQGARTLPGSWKNAAGMMRRHKRSMERYIAIVRKEWR